MDSHRRMKGSVKKDEPRNNSGNCGGLLMGTSCSYLPSSGLQGQKKRGEGRSFGQGPITSSMEKRVSPRSRLPPSSNGNIFLKIFPFHHLSVLHSSLFGLKVWTGSSSIEMNRPSGTTLASWPLRSSRECYHLLQKGILLQKYTYEIVFCHEFFWVAPKNKGFRFWTTELKCSTFHCFNH